MQQDNSTADNQTHRPLALITGASSGIGACFARKLAARGYDLALVARRKGRLDQLAAELERGHGISVQVFPADLTDPGELLAVERWIAAAERLDLLVNNAGFGTLGRFFETGIEGQDRMYRLHVIATARLTHAVLPGLMVRRRGGVINVSSVASFWRTPGNVSYCSTKAWVSAFTESLYVELKASGSPVRVQALCPGFTFTEFHDVMGVNRKRVPGGFWMKAGDVVDASLRGFDHDKLFVIPGWRYRLLVLLAKLLPRALRHAGVTRYAKHRGKKPGAAPQEHA
ncbi:MAG: SDR family oxidoreductase [Bryobacteraceae bacterium]